MARYDVFPNSGVHAAAVPFLLDVQSDLLQEFGTRIVVPLRRKSLFGDAKVPANLMPTLLVNEIEYVMETTKLAAVPSKILRDPVTRLDARHFEISAALDFVFHGF